MSSPDIPKFPPDGFIYQGPESDETEFETLALLFDAVQSFARNQCDLNATGHGPQSRITEYSQDVYEVFGNPVTEVVHTGIDIDLYKFWGDRFRDKKSDTSQEIRLYIWQDDPGLELLAEDFYRMQKLADGRLCLRIYKGLDEELDTVMKAADKPSTDIAWHDATEYEAKDVLSELDRLKKLLNPEMSSDKMV